MIFKQPQENPFEVQISFHKLIENLEQIAISNVDYRANYAKGLLAEVSKVPELRDGITDMQSIDLHKELIRNLLSDLFPTVLTRNEIKAITIPFHNITFNYSERFRQILNNAGSDFDMEIRDFDDHKFYVMSGCLILNAYYKQQLDTSKPFFYDIPDNGILKHYRILYNADFIEIFPTERAIALTADDINELLDNYDNLELWKQKFPPNSWVMKGFGIMSLFDSTIENAVSNLKTNLLIQKTESNSAEIEKSFQSIFQSIFKFTELEVGFTSVDPQKSTFTVFPFDKKNIKSFIVSQDFKNDCAHFLCDVSMEALIAEKKHFIISDVGKFNQEYPSSALGKQLLKQNIQSAIFAPIIKNGTLLGILEVVSTEKRKLNSINANKLNIVLPYLVDTIDRYYSDIQNQVEALIQKEYTTIHSSVYWKFRDEANKHIYDSAAYSLHEIVFNDVYPLFGQIDIKGSSDKRNTTTQDDIFVQIDLLASVFDAMNKERKLPIIEQKIFELREYQKNLKGEIKADTEQIIQNYIKSDLHPILKSHITDDMTVNDLIRLYFEKLDANSETIYESRKRFDETVSIINKKMADILDENQVEAQRYYPHYYERFKTDGVEHTMYIGNSITDKEKFDMLYLYNLRLWQLQVMCEMENQYHQLQPSLPYPVEVASLILVINLPITIRFRMDEKRFDVDGSYNARYEVVKKRIDKAFIKGTTERITAQNKITIVYAQQQEELEYKRYIQFLQHKNMLGAKVESFEIEDLQGVSGLKALRVEVVYNEQNYKLYSYQELLSEIEG